MNEKSRDRCPNCGQKFMEKIKFTPGITIWRETDEICLYETDDGEKLMFLHLDGGDGHKDNMSKEERQKIDRKSRS